MPDPVLHRCSVAEGMTWLLPIAVSGVALLRYSRGGRPRAKSAIRTVAAERLDSTHKSHSWPRQRIVELTRKRSFAPAMLTIGSSQLIEQRLCFFEIWFTGRSVGL